MYQLIASNLEQARKKTDTKAPRPDRNLVRVILFYFSITPQVCGTLGIPETNNSKGKVKIVHISDVKYVLLADSIISKLPNYLSFSRQSKLRIDPKDIPILKWEPTVTVNANFLTVSSKLDSATSLMDSLNPSPVHHLLI